MANPNTTRRKLVVTNSEIGTFRSCRQRWWFAYSELLRPKRTTRPLAVGSSVHSGLCAMYLQIQATHGGEPLSVDALTRFALDAMQANLGSFLKDLYDRMDTEGADIDAIVEESKAAEAEARSSVERYVTRFGVEDAERYRVLAVEQAFRVPLRAADGRRTPRIVEGGVWDLVLWDPDVADVVLVEHKTSRGDAREAESKLDMDPQTTGYVWALDNALHDARLCPPLTQAVERFAQRGSNGRYGTGRVFYNVIRKKGPRLPDITKGGLVSSAPVDTMQHVYEEALCVQETTGYPGVDRKGVPIQVPTPRTEKQRDRLDALPVDEAKYVCRHETWHSLADCERWREEQVADGRELRRALRGTLPITRNPEQCNHPWSMPCPFRGICIQDSIVARVAEYRKVSDPHVEVVEAEGAGEL